MAVMSRQIIPVMVGSLLGLVAAIVLLGLAWQQHVAATQSQLAEAWVAAQRRVLDQEVQRIEDLVTALAAQPALASQPAPALLESLARQHQLVSLRWLPGSALALDERAAAPINYGVLDLLRRAWSGQRTYPEAYQREGGWLLYAVAAIRDASGQPLAVLLQASELPRLLQKLPPLPDGAGQLQLIQTYAGNPPQELLSQGQGQGPHWQWPTAHPDWQLHFTAGQVLPGLPPRWMLLLAALLVPAGTLCGCLLSVLLQRRAAARLEITPMRTRSSRPPPPPELPLEPASSRNRPADAAGRDVFDLGDGK